MTGGEESAGEHNGDVEQALEEMVAGVVGAHGAVVGFFGTQVFLVGFAEFPEFQGFVGEALDHADAFQESTTEALIPATFFRLSAKVSSMRLFWMAENQSMIRVTTARHSPSCQLMQSITVKEPRILMRDMNRFSGPW